MFVLYLIFSPFGNFSPTPPYLALTWLYYLTMEPVPYLMLFAHNPT